MQFQTYEKYKPSGIDWLGEIPEGWEVKRLKDLGCFQNGISNNAEYFGSGFPFVSYGNIYNNTLSKEKIVTLANSTKEDQKLYSVKENDVFFTRTSETIEEVGFTATCKETIPYAVFSGFVIRFRPYRKDIQKEYSSYFFNAKSHRNFFVKEMNIVTRASLSQNVLSNLPVLVPNKQTQTAIADYLDQHTALIDKKIALLKAKKQSYTQLKQTLINEVVTKGLDETVEMKDSGIEWIGQIPKHWEVKRLKQIFNERVEKNSLPNGEPVTENILSVMKDVGVINHRDKGLVGNKMSEDITGYKLVQIDDIVVNKMNVMIGSVGISKEFGALSVIYIILKAKSSYLPKFYDYLFRIKRFQKHLRTISTGILEIREAVNMILFMGQEFPVPPKSEQIAIANYLDEKTSKIDEIIKKIDENILALQEFRKTLINDVVTGKVKVL